jgi:hypothetical protein
MAPSLVSKQCQEVALGPPRGWEQVHAAMSNVWNMFDRASTLLTPAIAAKVAARLGGRALRTLVPVGGPAGAAPAAGARAAAAAAATAAPAAGLGASRDAARGR